MKIKCVSENLMAGPPSGQSGASFQFQVEGATFDGASPAAQGGNLQVAAPLGTYKVGQEYDLPFAPI